MLGIACVFLLAIVGLSYREWRHYSEANAEATQTREIVAACDRVLGDFIDAEAGQRGFLLTGENRYLEPYNRGIQALPNEIATLKRSVAGRPGESGNVAQLDNLADQKLAELRETIELRRTQGAGAASALVLSDRDKERMDAIRALCTQIQRQENAAQAEASLEGEAASRATLLVSVVGSLVLVLLLAIGLEPFGAAGAGLRTNERSLVARYGAAVLATIACTLLRMGLTPIIGPAELAFSIFLPAVLFSAWFGGFRAGAVAIVLSALASDYYFAEPVGSLAIRKSTDQISLLIFVVIGCGVALLSDAQRRAVAWARQSRDWLQTTITSIGDGVITTDANGRVSLMNPVAESLTGWTQKDGAGKPLEQVFVIYNEETGLKAENPATKVLREGRIVGLANHTRLVTRDGRQIPIDDSAAPIRDGGRIAGVVLVFRDITERVKAEERVRLAVEAAPNAMIMVGNNGDIQLVNSQTEKVFGYGREELLGQPVEVLVPDRYRGGHGALRTFFLAAPVARPMGAGRELFGRRKDGREIPIEIGLNPISTTQGEAVLAAIIDISERKLAEEGLRVVNDELRRTTHLMEPVACFVRDLEDRIVYWNPGAADLYGFPSDEALGKISHSLLQTEFPAPLEKILAEVTSAGAWDGELLNTRRDGQRVTVASHWALHKDQNGQPAAILEVNLDISDRKEAEEKLRVTNAALARANEDLNQFAFAASHDLQEPLRVITSYSQLLLKGYRGQIEGQAATWVGFITEGTKRMRELLADLLAYTRLTGEEQESVAPVDLNEVFQTTLENCKAAIEETLAVVTSDPLPVVMGYRPHFGQVFQNLISNSLKYRSQRPPRIHVSAERQNGRWRIAVKDNGIGIAPEYHKVIFGVFKRLHGRSIPGTGIGLAICQRVVERYGGEIRVESQVDEGATFYFTLPAAAKADTAQQG